MERPESSQITWVSMGAMASPMESVETGDSGSSFSKYCRYRAWENLDQNIRGKNKTKFAHT